MKQNVRLLLGLFQQHQGARNHVECGFSHQYNIHQEEGPKIQGDLQHLGFANGWQPTIGMPLLPFYSHLKINHHLLVTAALARRNTGLWLARETAEKGENKQNCKIWDFIWRENGFLKLFLTLNCFLSHLKASPVGCDPSHTGDGKAPPVTGSHSSSRPPILVARANNGALRITAKHTSRRKGGIICGKVEDFDAWRSLASRSKSQTLLFKGQLEK